MGKKATSRTGSSVQSSPENELCDSQENLQQLFLAGMGLADETNEKLHEIFKSLVKKGRIRQPRVKKAVTDIRKRVLARRKELQRRFREFFEQDNFAGSRLETGPSKKSVRRGKIKKVSPLSTKSRPLATRESRTSRKMRSAYNSR